MHKPIATFVLMAVWVPAAPSIAAGLGSTALSHAVATVAGTTVIQVRGGMAGGGGMGMGGGSGMGMGSTASMGNGSAASDLPARDTSGSGPRSSDRAACMASYASDTSWLTRWARCAVGLKGDVHSTPAVATRNGKKPSTRRVASSNVTGNGH